MKTLYLDLFSGLSGDMFLGAMIDLGVNPATLEAELRRLNLPGWHLHTCRATKSGIAGIKLDVHLDTSPGHTHHHDHPHDDAPGHPHDHEHVHADGTRHSHPHHHDTGHHHEHSEDPTHRHCEPEDPHHHAEDHGGQEHRTFATIRSLIESSPLSPWVRQHAVAVFARVAEAEGRIHGLPPDQVHFHEVGAIDSIVDIVGACIALEQLGRPRVLASPVVEGTGFLRCAHGRYPLPGPATLAILGARGIPVTQCEEPAELVTPTGAALLAEFAESFALMSGLVAEKIGFGLGTRENRTRPNVVRAILGNLSDPTAPLHDWESDRVAVLETNLDDVSSEVLGHFLDQTLAAGALDVFYTPIQMKKGRPGVLLTVLCAENEADRFAERILRETTAFGVRRTVAERRKLRREWTEVTTPHGKVTVKLGRLDGQVVQAAPEYESCRTVAARAGVPVKAVFEAAQQAWSAQPKP